MSEKIKAVYLDSNGNQHDSKNAAKKANRLIEAAATLAGNLIIDGDQLVPTCEDGGIDDQGQSIIEFARAVVSIYGMKDKAK